MVPACWAPSANALPPTLAVSEPPGIVMTPVQTPTESSNRPGRVKMQVTSRSPTSLFDASRRSLANVSWSPFESFSGPSGPSFVFGGLSTKLKRSVSRSVNVSVFSLNLAL